MRRQLRETGWLIAGLFGLSVSACGVLAGQPQEPPASIENAELSSRVPELLDRLGSGTLATRASAERELLTLGPVVLEHLPRWTCCGTSESDKPSAGFASNWNRPQLMTL